MTSPVDLPSAIRQAVLYNLNNVHTALPASVISYDYTVQKATVQPLLNKVWFDGTVTPMPVLENVPVIFPKSGGASLTFPVNPGDTCLLLFIERSTDLWLTQGGQVSPDDPRKFDLSDGVAIMGLFPFSQNSLADNNTDLLLTYQRSSFRIKQNGAIVIQTSDTVAIGDTTTEVLDIISQTLNLLATSLTTAEGTPFEFAASWASLKTQIDALRGTIP
jgi:hypothetical protein